MQSLNHPVGGRIIGAGRRPAAPQNPGEFSEQGRDKLTSLVECNALRCSKSGDPMVEEGAADGSGCHVGDGNNFRPARRAVHDGEQVSATIRDCQRSDEVDLYVQKSRCWGLEAAGR